MGISSEKHVGLFATCPVDLFRPVVGHASVRLLEAAGYQVTVPAQSCCGQVAYNNGDPDAARRLAWQLVVAFEQFDYIVLPSGSCAAMVRRHYPALFDGDARQPRVMAFCERVYELTVFLDEVAHFTPAGRIASPLSGTVTYHDSCAGLRELGIRQQPRRLLERCAGIAVTEMPDTDVCCGFGGTFCVKFPDISNRMVSDKLDNARTVSADVLLGGDVSCLLHIAGRAARRGDTLEVRHVAEVLADELEAPGIGAGEDKSGRPG